MVYVKFEVDKNLSINNELKFIFSRLEITSHFIIMNF